MIQGAQRHRLMLYLFFSSFLVLRRAAAERSYRITALSTRAGHAKTHMSLTVASFSSMLSRRATLPLSARGEHPRLMLGDLFRFLSSKSVQGRGKHKPGVFFHKIPDKALSKFLKRFENESQLRDVLLSEMFLVEQPSKKKGVVRIVAPLDRMWAFLRFPRSLEFSKYVLVSENFTLLEALAKCAYRASDTDFPGLVVSSLNELELVRFLTLLFKQRGKESLRMDSLDTAIVSKWAQLNCKDMLSFLPSALEPVLALPDGFEMDVNKMRHSSLAQGNVRNIEVVCDAVVREFCKQPRSRIHPLLLNLLRSLREMDVSLDDISGLVVLRILTPAILNPEKFRLVNFNLMAAQKRGLLMVAKIMQQIANGIAFDESCPQACMNPMIVTHHQMLMSYLNSISTTSEAAPVPRFDLPENYHDNLRALLSRFPVYADDIMPMLEFGSDALAFRPNNSPSAVRFPLSDAFFAETRTAFARGRDAAQQRGRPRWCFSRTTQVRSPAPESRRRHCGRDEKSGGGLFDERNRVESSHVAVSGCHGGAGEHRVGARTGVCHSRLHLRVSESGRLCSQTSVENSSLLCELLLARSASAVSAD